VSATVSEAGSMTPDFVREQLPVETRKGIIDVERRQSVIQQQAEEQPLRAAVDPLFRTQVLMGTPARERIIKGLEQGGTPVRDERGMTVGVVRKGAGAFGGDDYVGRPDYNPIAARINRITRTGDQFPMFEERGGVIRARALTATERAMTPGQDEPARTIMGAAPPAAPPPATTGVTGAPELDAAAAAARAEEQVRMQRSRRRGRTATIVGGLLDDAPASGQAPTLLG